MKGRTGLGKTQKKKEEWIFEKLREMLNDGTQNKQEIKKREGKNFLE